MPTIGSLSADPPMEPKPAPDVVRRVYFDASTGRVQIELRGWKGHTRVQCFNPLGALVEVCVRSERAKYVSHQLLACVSQGADACRYAVQFER